MPSDRKPIKISILFQPIRREVCVKAHGRLCIPSFSSILEVAISLTLNHGWINSSSISGTHTCEMAIFLPHCKVKVSEMASRPVYGNCHNQIDLVWGSKRAATKSFKEFSSINDKTPPPDWPRLWTCQLQIKMMDYLWLGVKLSLGEYCWVIQMLLFTSCKTIPLENDWFTAVMPSLFTETRVNWESTKVKREVSQYLLRE